MQQKVQQILQEIVQQKVQQKIHNNYVADHVNFIFHLVSKPKHKVNSDF